MKNSGYGKILIIQTAFAGDVILTFPMVQVLKENFPESKISFLCIPGVANLLENNPDISEIILYDKKKKQRGFLSFRKLIKEIKDRKFDLLISPHRSMRSTLIAKYSGAKKTISFDTSSLSGKYTDRVIYKKKAHEIIRNLSLLAPLGIVRNEIITPKLYPSEKDISEVDKILSEFKIEPGEKFIAVAPGSVWFTKAFPDYKFAKVMSILNDFHYKVVMIGGSDDAGLCALIKVLSRNKNICNAAGKLTYLQSAELIRRAGVLLTNDSAPMHLANSVGTKVTALFGATVPEFGFYPIGKDDTIFQTDGLKCRPCGIHGGNRCPVKTFDCMKKINDSEVALELVKSLIS
jgi:heptosyltransferase II